MQTFRTVTEELIALEDRYGAHNYLPLDVVLTRGEGVWVWDVDGNRYMDCLSAYSAVNQGHGHPRIREALIEQANRLPLTSRAFRNDQLGLFYQQLCELTGYDGLPEHQVRRSSRRSCRAQVGYTIKGVPDGQAEIIACAGNFAGRTVTIVGFSTEPQYRDGFGPFTPGFKVVPYGDAQALEAAITPNTVAFIVEPIQGEGGVIVPPAGYLRQVRDLCTRHNVLMIADEIQTGWPHGPLFACDHEDVKPDMVTIGKALSGGFYGVGGAQPRILGVFRPGDHGSTFGGNPLGGGGQAALSVLSREHDQKRRGDGRVFQDMLAGINSPHVKGARQRLMIGVDFAGGRRRAPLLRALQENGILAKETHRNIIRLPALVITQEDIDWAIERIRPVLVMD